MGCAFWRSVNSLNGFQFLRWPNWKPSCSREWGAWTAVRAWTERQRSSASERRSRGVRRVNRFVLSPQAIDDVETIRAYIARANEDAADRVIEAVYKTCEILAQHPGLGFERKFSAKALSGLRMFVISDFPNNVIFYRVREEEVQIVRVLHGARNIERLFEH